MLELFFHLMILICFLFSFNIVRCWICYYCCCRRHRCWRYLLFLQCVFLTKIVANFHQFRHHHSLCVFGYPLYGKFRNTFGNLLEINETRKCYLFHDVYSLFFIYILLAQPSLCCSCCLTYRKFGFLFLMFCILV